MRFLTAFVVFALTCILFFIPPIRAGEDHGTALAEEIGLSYGERSEVIVLTGKEADTVDQEKVMEMIETTIDYVGLQMELPSVLVASENLYGVEDGFVKDGMTGKSMGQVSTSFINGWFGVKFFAAYDQSIHIGVKPTDSNDWENYRKEESINLVNVPGGYMNVEKKKDNFLFGHASYFSECVDIRVYVPGYYLMIKYFDAVAEGFNYEHKFVDVKLDRVSALVESAKNLTVFEPTGEPEEVSKIESVFDKIMKELEG